MGQERPKTASWQAFLILPRFPTIYCHSKKTKGYRNTENIKENVK
jgi:hypothetical protein